ncbi:similar to Saccharomyces cerevisiae YLR098C CHA4 DNA binding transcriptional activator, mediates serine/threonine activation of the catabolic L-serine (L-threonine) deaminase (CHA1) [Maudiozyma saulgeensis]|uniref:Similar to Saccharomyces cerevisiae YLR098C CHA4 DNA binding transcriptional activator, mediates serine/threonine activation of the catabolic L-serine (L-threonine) deaminase (CHA1) n=1 Tax=Maudiozyma saulgeensis TaxID=1789683 RepID=A0A1X7R4R4_9SACH|nr:similar to Saccharomyces cerevisiae YLR098C CHA4 DNA binding transcriptional activator, mediates serine/threonine activation of the catabolic L-serine (L-threonine) deaminase (CHA1) [Kazachstania saulgeensis]
MTGIKKSISKTVKRNSCINCKERKVRCDLLSPCSICQRRNEICVYPSKDNRSIRLTVGKMKQLESRLVHLEKILEEIRNQTQLPDEVIRILNGVSDEDHLPSCLKSYDSRVTQFSILTIPENDKSNSVMLGPTSVYKKYDSAENTPIIETDNAHVLGNHTNMFTEDDITFYNFVPCEKSLFDDDLYESIASFFKWQYPSNYMFIHRESFLYHFLLLDFDNDFVSEELIYSIAAVGSRFSSNRALQLKAEGYYTHAKKFIFMSPETSEIDFSTANLTKLQSLLCLAFFDISKGNLTSGWILSGIAFRIGSAIGFERDPSEWIYGQRTKLNIRAGYPFDLKAVQRRIYWGTYIADHFISLIFGRYPSLRYTEASIMSSSDLYNLPNIKDFLFYDREIMSYYSCDVLIPLKVLIDLAQISESMILDVFSPVTKSEPGTEERNREIQRRLKRLQDYNNSLDKWVLGLPPQVSLDKKDLLSSGHNCINLSVRSSYFLTRLSLNRPFVQYPDDENINKSPSFCEKAVIELYMVLKSIDRVYGLPEFEPTLPLVYSMVLGTSILTLKLSCGEETLQGEPIKLILDLFLKYLSISEGSLEIAKNAMDIAQGTFKNKNDNSISNLQSRILSSDNGLDEAFLDKLLSGDVIDCVFDPGFFLSDSGQS